MIALDQISRNLRGRLSQTSRAWDLNFEALATGLFRFIHRNHNERRTVHASEQLHLFRVLERTQKIRGGRSSIIAVTQPSNLGHGKRRERSTVS